MHTLKIDTLKMRSGSDPEAARKAQIP